MVGISGLKKILLPGHISLSGANDLQYMRGIVNYDVFERYRTRGEQRLPVGIRTATVVGTHLLRCRADGDCKPL